MIKNDSGAPVKADQFTVCNGSISLKSTENESELSGRCGWCDHNYTGAIS
jgi:hypothetical protein